MQSTYHVPVVDLQLRSLGFVYTEAVQSWIEEASVKYRAGLGVQILDYLCAMKAFPRTPLHVQIFPRTLDH